MDAIRADEKVALLDAAIGETYFDPARCRTNLYDLSAEADIGAFTYEVVQGGLQVGTAEQDIATERFRQHRGTFAAKEASRRCVEPDLFERSGARLTGLPANQGFQTDPQPLDESRSFGRTAANAQG